MQNHHTTKLRGPGWLLLLATLLALTIGAAAVSAAPMRQDAPADPPQPLAGQAIYLQNCAGCHGTTGKGDGDSAASLSVPPVALGEYDKIAGRSLVELFGLTKNGNMQRMMPPWRDILTDQEIWDTVAYAWSLHTSGQELAAGGALYADNCASCHGVDGKGVTAGATDLTSFAATAAMSQATWAAAVADGKGAMPAFAGKLSAEEQRATLVYVRSLSLGGPLFRGPLAAGAGVISGTITNGTTGQPVPGLTVDLGIFDTSALLEQRTAQTDSAGVYRFTDLPTDADLAYAARVQYPPGTPYSTDFASFEAGQTAIDLPVTVYDTTDQAAVRLDRVHFIVEFSGDRALVAELLVFSLDGERTYTGDGEAVLRFTLPDGAIDLAINNEELGGRFQVTAGGFVDLLPLPPGQNVRQVVYRYALPYSGGKLDLTRALAYPAANVNALVSDAGQKITGEGLADQGLRQTEGGSYYNFLAQNVPAGQEISLRMTNLPAASVAGETATASPAIPQALIIALAAAAAAITAFFILRRGRATQDAGIDPAGREALIDALADLDRAHEDGEISDAAYRDQRLRLKARLRDLLQKEGEA